MTKLEKILTLMRDSKDECEVFIKCYDVNRFIVVRQIVAKFNNHVNLNINYLEHRYNNHINNGNDILIVRLTKYIDRIEIENAYPMINYDESKAYTDTDVLEEDKKNENLNAMLGNFFEALNQCINVGLEPEVKCVNKSNNKGNKVKDVLKIFDKGKVDIKQVIVQMYLKDLTSNVQFVKELVRKELARIKNEIVENFTPIHNLDTYNLKFLASVDYLEDIKNRDSIVDLECAYMFYLYEKEIAKELRLLGKPDYSWIKDFIIQKNVMSQKRVDLFKSNKFEIFIEDGSIHLVDVKPNIGYSLDIKYNEETNTFHL